MDNVREFTARARGLPPLYYYYLDRSVPRVKERWAGLAVALVLFVTRILLAGGWYIVCYAHGIYLLNLFLAFLTPKIDPSIEEDMRTEEAEEGVLPNRESEEYRPFIRRLPEFKFWYHASVATLLAIFLTFFRIMDIPVFWPILVVYFVLLFVLTMRRQIQHMVRYRYLPFDLGKKQYT